MAVFSETNLPRYNAEDLPGTTRKLYNFCRELQEMIQFVLSNLDADNIEGYEEIFNRLEGSEGAVSKLWQTADEIGAQVRKGEEKLAELTVTAEEISSRVQDAGKGVSELRQTAAELSARVGDNAGNISALQQTAQGIETRVSNTEGGISALEQTAKGIESRVSDAEGSITQIRQTATGLQSTVSDLNGKYTSIKQTVDSIDIEGDVNMMMQEGFAEFAVVDSRGRVIGNLTSDGSGLYLSGDRGLALNGGRESVSIVSGDKISLGNSSEEVQVWVSARRYWTFSTSGIYYCDEDGNHLNSVLLNG